MLFVSVMLILETHLDCINVIKTKKKNYFRCLHNGGYNCEMFLKVIRLFFYENFFFPMKIMVLFYYEIVLFC